MHFQAGTSVLGNHRSRAVRGRREDELQSAQRAPRARHHEASGRSAGSVRGVNCFAIQPEVARLGELQ